jgi:hypothetical protein
MSNYELRGFLKGLSKLDPEGMHQIKWEAWLFRSWSPEAVNKREWGKALILPRIHLSDRRLQYCGAEHNISVLYSIFGHWCPAPNDHAQPPVAHSVIFPPSYFHIHILHSPDDRADRHEVALCLNGCLET